MTTCTISEAKTQLSKLITRAAAGEEIVIARGTRPAVRLTAIGKRRFEFGAMEGCFENIPDAFFFDPLSEDDLKLWEGGEDDLI